MRKSLERIRPAINKSAERLDRHQDAGAAVSFQDVAHLKAHRGYHPSILPGSYSQPDGKTGPTLPRLI